MAKNGNSNRWGLTKREEEVLVAYRTIGHAKGVGAKLGISSRTVEEHLASARAKMGADTTLQAVVEYHASLSSPEETAPENTVPKETVTVRRKPVTGFVFVCVIALAAYFIFRSVNASASTELRPFSSYPKGKKLPELLAIVKVREDANWQIALISADTWEAWALTGNEHQNSGATWSPDGKRIAFESNRRGNYDIYVMNADGTDVRLVISSEGNEERPSWTPDGKRIVFNSDVDGTRDVYIADADGGGWQTLAKSGGSDSSPVVSPDGKWVAFISDRERGYDIYVVSITGGEERRLTWGKADCNRVSWSKSGRKIAFHSNYDGNWEIYTLSLEGGEPVRVTKTRDMAEEICTFVGDIPLFTRFDSPNRSLWASGKMEVMLHEHRIVTESLEVRPGEKPFAEKLSQVK